MLVCSHCFSAAARVINVKKYGVVANGIADETKALQKIIDLSAHSGRDTIYFPAGTYLIASYTKTANYLENYCLKLKSNITFVGEGDKSIIRLASNLFNKKDTAANAHIFYGRDIQNIVFRNILIDMNGNMNRVPDKFIKNHCAIFIYKGTNFNISNSKITNCAGRNMLIIKGAGTNATINNCRFINGGRYVGSTNSNLYQTDFSFIYSEWDSTIVSNNIIQQNNVNVALSGYTGGVEIHGSYSIVKSNIIVGCYPAIYLSSSWHDMFGTVVENNTMRNCVKGVSFWVNYSVNNIRIANNSIGVTYNRFQPQAISCGIEIPNGNSKNYSFALANNAPLHSISITGNDIYTVAPTGGYYKTAGIMIHSMNASNIEENKIKGMTYGGIVMAGSKWGTDTLLIRRNVFDSFKPLKNQPFVCGYIIISDTYTDVDKTVGGLKQIIISGNQTANLPKSGVDNFFAAFVAVPKKNQEQIVFQNNSFTDDKNNVRRVDAN
jgi:hypothetical protein